MLGCNSIKSVKQALLKTSPYDDYVQSLGKAGLKESALAKQWIKAGEQALNDSILVTLPYAETGFFEAARPEARAYRFQVHAGQILTISGQTKTSISSRLFTDVFVWKKDHWQSLVHADSGLALVHEFDKDALCLLRIQPELLSETWYTLTITLQPALINPVKGATNKSIGSFYGNARDEGKRSHEGVDIFAAKGTPVLAPTDGIVYSTGTNNLGGKVVWLYDLQRGQTYYFAHLDSQWVSTSMSLKQGDTLGQVGNTGNARNTAPHLHFGIYRNGSLDPLHYIQTTSSISSMMLDTSLSAKVYKVSVKEGSLHSAPETKSKVLYKYPKGTYVRQVAKTKNWSRVVLPEGQQAYVQSNDISLTTKGKRLVLKNTDTLWSAASDQALPVKNLNASEVLEILAQYKGFNYVKTGENLYGWIKL
jgi:murein DD-endopeptidase MepM/ murein hydrolase activator NlpD/SH3-like domain-containing protein